MPQDNLTELKRRVPGGKYTLARAIAERARQLQSGQCIPLVEVKTPNPLSVAIDEIVQGKITFRVNENGDDTINGKKPSSADDPTLPAGSALDELLGTVGAVESDTPIEKPAKPARVSRAKKAKVEAEPVEAESSE